MEAIPLGTRTNRIRHKVKQGVRPVNVIQEFIMPDGTIKAEDDLTPEERMTFAQKVLDAFTPILYDSVMRDLELERKTAN